jgi:hypothetical protein
MSYIIHFVGLVHFLDRGRDGKLAMLPDGRSHPDISPHNTSFFIQNDDIVECDGWWKPEPNPDMDEEGVTEFRVRRPSKITISGMESTGKGCWPFGSKLDTSGLQRLPELANEKGLRIVPGWAATMVQMPIRQGKLASFLFLGEEHGAGVSTLTVSDHSGPVTILARLDSSGGFRVLKLRDGAEIALANTSDLFTEERDGDENHFRLYGLLDVDRREDTLEPPPDPPHLPPLQFDHAYLRYIEEHTGTVGGSGCSNTCC